MVTTEAAGAASSRAAAGTASRAGLFGIGAQTGLFVLYCAAFFGLRAAFTSALEQDAAVRHFEAQVLALSYGSNDPALYSWLLRGVHEVVGLGLHSSMLLNYAFLTGAFWAVLVSARMVLREPRWAALAAWSLVLFPPVLLGHFALAHSTQLLFASALALLTFLRLVRYGRPLDYLIFGVAVGLGAMAKYNFPLFVAAAGLAGLVQAPVRQRLFSPWIVAAGAVAVVVASPVLIAFGHTMGQLDNTFGLLSMEVSGPVLSRLVGLKSAGASLFSYTGPMLVVLLVVAPGAVFRPVAPPEAAGMDPVLARFVRDFLLAGLVVMVLVVLVSGTGKFHERYMQPLLFATPLYFLGRILRARPEARVWRRYAAGVVLVTAGVLGLRALELSPLCPQSCRDLVPYDRLAGHLRAEGFTGGTIVTGSPIAAGNLRVQFPEARVLLGASPALPRNPAGSGQCLAIWDMTDWGPETSRQAALAALGLTAEEAAPLIRSAAIPWHWPFFSWSWPPGWYQRETEWQYVLFEDETRCP